MDAADKRMLDREALRNMIQQWNANRLDLFELSEPNENLEFHGVMRFYFQDSGQKIATKCIRVASDATVSDVIETLIEKFRPDMRMLSLGSYSLWETHGPDDERRLEPHEKPLLVQLNWHTEDREGRFLLKCLSNNEVPLSGVNEKGDQNFKRKLSKREKKELKKKEKLSRLKSDTNDETRPVAEKLYTELPETSFTRSISNPEAVMRRRRQQKLERKLQQFRSKDGGPDTGGTLKIYGSSLCPDVPYKTLLLSVGDSAAAVVREMLDKYGLSRQDPQHYCIVQVRLCIARSTNVEATGASRSACETHGSLLCPDVYKTLLLSVGDSAAAVVREMLDKYGLSRQDPQHYCIVQVGV
ncbi:afadin-like [Ostrinia nubilalis]|uniref:afadin-like n=1 Tax=Ostrinia nubilalis TaxID=29057 RepID=UPI0030824DC1